MNNQALIDLLMSGPGPWNAWRKSLPFSFTPQPIFINDILLKDADLSGIDLSHTVFTNAKLDNCNFYKAHMNGVSLIRSHLYLVRFVHASLNQSNLSGAEMTGCDFSEAYLRDANLSNIKTKKYQDVIYVKFWKAVLIGSDLSHADLQASEFYDANMATVNLEGSMLQNVSLLSSNICFSNFIRTNLTGATLSFAHLTGSNFTEGILDGAKLDHSNLHLASFEKASATKANFSNSNLNETKCAKADFTGSDFTKASFNKADLDNASLYSTVLTNVSFVETNLSGTRLSNSSIFGVSAWDIKTSPSTEQLNLLISKNSEATISVDNLEIAQFINLLLYNEKIRDVINTVGNKAVLILGRFTPERKKVLHFVQSRLRAHNYIPILFDFEKPTDRDLTEMIVTLASLCKFIVGDLSDPYSIPLELHAIVPNYAIPLVTIIEKGKHPFALFKDLKKYSWVLETVTYTDIPYLDANFQQLIIDRAEAKFVELRANRHL